MKIVEASFEILNPKTKEEGIEALRFIEAQARISHRAEDKQTPDSWERFIKFVVQDKGDWSIVEHAYSTVRLVLDRGLTHELVRHRLFSFTQESTRFVNYGKKDRDLKFIRPSFTGVDPSKANFIWNGAIGDAEESYLSLLEEGVAPQIARSVLPNALASTISVTGNLRNWHHFLMMRTSKETHVDFRAVTIPLLAAFKERIPIIFDDIISEEKQSAAQSKPR